MMNYTPNVTTHVKKLILIPTKRGYNDVWQRSYDMNANYNNINKLAAVLNVNGANRGINVQDLAISKSMPELMTISEHTTGRVEVPYGWQTQRLRFLMAVDTTDGSSVSTTYLQGFTEYHDPSLTGRIDPNMIFYVNSLTTVNRVLDPMTGYYVVQQGSSYNVITDLAGGQKYQETDMFTNTNNLKLIRPCDLIDDLHIGDLYGNDDTYIVNKTGSIHEKANMSNRNNGDAVRYFTTTINAVITGKSLSSTSYSEADMLRNASMIVNEEMLMNVPFISELHKVTGEISPTTFTANTLLMLPGSHILDPVMATGDDALGIVEFGSAVLDSDFTADLLQPTIENKIATTIAHSVSSILADTMLVGMTFRFSNMSGVPVCIPIPGTIGTFIEGIDQSANVARLISRVEHILIPEISFNNQILVEGDVKANLCGDTTINLSVNMNPAILFRFPTFSDSLYTPVISSSEGRDSMKEKLGNILDTTYNLQ